MKNFNLQKVTVSSPLFDSLEIRTPIFLCIKLAVEVWKKIKGYSLKITLKKLKVSKTSKYLTKKLRMCPNLKIKNLRHPKKYPNQPQYNPFTSQPLTKYLINHRDYKTFHFAAGTRMTNSLIENIFLHELKAGSFSVAIRSASWQIPVACSAHKFMSNAGWERFCRHFEPLTELWLTNAWFTSPALQPSDANVYIARIFISRPLSPRNSLIVACDDKSRDKKIYFRNVVGGTVKGDRDKRSRLRLFGLKANVYFEKHSLAGNFFRRFDPPKWKIRKVHSWSFQCEGREQDHRYAILAALNHLRVNKIPVFDRK